MTAQDWLASEPIYYCQGYLTRDRERTVRVRIAGGAGFLTIKGISRGATRAEYEYTIPADEAKEIMQLCVGPLIEKNRRIVEHAGLKWEVDEFLGDNQGLVVAEVELDSEHQAIELPSWVGDEVTDDPRYFNSNLSAHPFKEWE